ncbi:triose-phosphate isomerase [Candidatus Bathyarchaeota archaeon RBG_13_52_12]|nr:MAG: triose-phosphate isomerase [Candidatus Bathyarchaeota archaeon RBG_13_52_12]
MEAILVKYPLILVNLKTYREGMGENAVRLAKTAEQVHIKTGASIAVAPQLADLKIVIDSSETPVFAQHVDPVGMGQFTGHVLPESVAEAGCVGTLINHSERQLPLEVIKATVKRAREADLVTVICVDTVEKGRQVAAFSPEAIAIEPPELIGSGISVSKAKPEVVSGAVTAIKHVNSKIRVLCGAGVTNGEDVVAAQKLGAEGILVASGVVKAKDPQAALLDLARSLRH